MEGIGLLVGRAQLEAMNGRSEADMIFLNECQQSVIDPTQTFHSRAY